MNKCTNCGYTTDNNINFCPMCGGKVEAEVFATQQIVVAPTYSEPVQKPNKAKMIVGMALSIESFITAIVMFFYVGVFSAILPEMGLIYGIVFAVINLPIGIVGLSLSKDTTNGRDTPIFCRLGKIFGLISVILTGVTLLLSIIAC